MCSAWGCVRCSVRGRTEEDGPATQSRARQATSTGRWSRSASRSDREWRAQPADYGQYGRGTAHYR